MSFSEEKRKKLIVPAVALMMCAVAMIGIGYAAVTSHITITDNNGIVEYKLSATLYKDENYQTVLGQGGFTESNPKVNYYTKQVNNSIEYFIDQESTEIGKAYLLIETTDEAKASSNLTITCSVTVAGPHPDSHTTNVYYGSEILTGTTLDNKKVKIPITIKMEGTQTAAGASALPITYTVNISVSYVA